MLLSRLISRFAACDRGATAVEFALVAPLLIAVSIGTIEFGRGLLLRNDLSYAADFGARKVLNEPTIDDAALEQEVRLNFLGPLPGALVISIGSSPECQPLSSACPKYRTIELSYPFAPLLLRFRDALPLKLTLEVTRQIPEI